MRLVMLILQFLKVLLCWKSGTQWFILKVSMVSMHHREFYFLLIYQSSGT